MGRFVLMAFSAFVALMNVVTVLAAGDVGYGHGGNHNETVLRDAE